LKYDLVDKRFLVIKGYQEPFTFYTEIHGQKYIDFVNQEIQFGTYSYQDKKNDVTAVNKTIKTGKSVTFETKVKGKKILKSFIPIDDAKPYVIGVVSDYETIKGVLKKQLDFLINRNCNEAQGYLFSKLLSAAEFQLLHESIQETAAARIED
jgi:hypothetical protein